MHRCSLSLQQLYISRTSSWRPTTMPRSPSPSTSSRRRRDDDYYEKSSSRYDDRRERHRSRSPAPRSERRRSRSPRRDDDRRRDDKERRRRRSRSYNDSESSYSSDSDYERRRRRRRKEEKRERKERRERHKEKKARKERKKAMLRGEGEYGQFGIIQESDLYRKDSEFRTWLLEERKLNVETVGKSKEKELFRSFMEAFNTATLPHEKYYDLEKYERRQQAIRMGETVESNDMYNPNADMDTLRSTSRKNAASASSVNDYLDRAKLEELRRVQNERVSTLPPSVATRTDSLADLDRDGEDEATWHASARQHGRLDTRFCDYCEAHMVPAQGVRTEYQL